MIEFAGGLVNGDRIGGPVFIFYENNASEANGKMMIKVSGNNLSLSVPQSHACQLNTVRRLTPD